MSRESSIARRLPGYAAVFALLCFAYAGVVDNPDTRETWQHFGFIVLGFAAGFWLLRELDRWRHRDRPAR